MPLGGFSFDPAGTPNGTPSAMGAGQQSVGPQEAIRILNLRMPRGGRSPIPWQLLTASGGKNPLAAIIEALAGGGGYAQGAEGGVPGGSIDPRFIPIEDKNTGPVQEIPPTQPLPPGYEPPPYWKGMPGKMPPPPQNDQQGAQPLPPGYNVPGGTGNPFPPSGIAIGEPTGGPNVPPMQQRSNRGRSFPGIPAPPLF